MEKRVIPAALTLILAASSVWMSAAQPPQGGRQGTRPGMNAAPPVQMTASEAARNKAEILKKELDLTDKQYKKVFKLYRRQADKELSARQGGYAGTMSGDGPEGGGMSGGPGGMGMRGGGRMGGGGMPGGGMGGGMPGGGMPEGGMRPGRPDGVPPPGAGEPYVEDDKDIAAREKKMKKILSESQFPKWREWERNDRSARIMQMLRQEPELPRDGR